MLVSHRQNPPRCGRQASGGRRAVEQRAWCPGTMLAVDWCGPILVVDDSLDANESLSLLLRLREGFEPSIIVLDLRMPVMDGREVLWALTSDARLARFPVIVHSADPPRCLAGVVIGQVPKGHDPSVLLDLVATACPLPGSA